jgi:acylphosphatase
MSHGVLARAHAIFRGTVQGVYFRAHCAERARELGLTGFVRNLPDGSVEAVFEGEREDIEACISWNRASQPHARVSSADVAWSVPTGEFGSFEVRR